MGKESREKKQRRQQGAAQPAGDAAARPPLPDCRALEKTMSDLHRILAAQNFANIDEANRFMADLTGQKRIPRLLPDLVGFGDENEAIAYAADALVNWRRTPGALEWLVASLRRAERQL